MMLLRKPLAGLAVGLAIAGVGLFASSTALATTRAAGITTAVAAADNGSVIARNLNPDGSGSETIYTAVQGASSSDLYASLQAAGVRGLVAPTTSAALASSPAALTSCTYGSASLFQCSPPAADTNPAHQIHWTNSGFAHVEIEFADATSAVWPVQQATTEWNQAQGIDSAYVNTCLGISGVHCVTVGDANFGNTCYQGRTYVEWNSSYNITGADVNLNDYQGTGTCNGHSVNYYKNAAGYRQDACHEMGHALGMGHNTSTSSCLYSTIINSTGAELPSSQDFTLIARLYSTPH